MAFILEMWYHKQSDFFKFDEEHGGADLKIEELLEGIDWYEIKGSTDQEIETVVYDSRKVVPNALFICIEGSRFDGHDAAADAVQKGATALVISKDVILPPDNRVTLIRVKNTRYAMAFIAAAYFNHPARKLRIIGITGTKGKTTTTYLIKNILEKAGYRVGLVGTIETLTGKRSIPSHNTTPESFVLQSYFAEMVEAGCSVVVMEVSSQGLMMHRTQGFTFEVGIFTNLEPDHIGPNEHASFEEYAACKSLLFRQCDLGIVNTDDQHWKTVLENHTCRLQTFGFNDNANYSAFGMHLYREAGDLCTEFDLRGDLHMHVVLHAPGAFSVYNALTAIAVCAHFEVPKEKILLALKESHVKGRIEMVSISKDYSLLIDYAHNAMALKSLLTTLREYQPKRLVCLFGCGGNRSKLRRYEMGEVSGELADLSVITSDNPRFEEPEAIIADIREGMERTGGNFVEIADRKEAIYYVIHHAMPGDIIVLAGKGHEDYQEIKGVQYPMDERVLIREVLEGR